ncbi:MAG: peptide chain release factor N(5)-glutamine methyltransferase [Lachnospiraceae bacterium]
MQDKLSFQDILHKGGEILKQAGINCSGTDAWYLLEYVTGMDRAEYFLKKNDAAPLWAVKKYQELIDTRASHMPLQYITGSQEFMGLIFKVSEDVLVPRQDTETLVEYVLPFVKDRHILDMCTGSGCIAISLAKLGSPALCTAADYSVKALETARLNARLNGVNIKFVQGDMFENITGNYGVIVSNPPYIRTGVIDTLMPEVREHEPRMALDGGKDGLFFYRIITSQAKKHLEPGGIIAVETGHDQGEWVKSIFEESGYKDVCIQKDLCGNNRVVAAVMP